MSEAPNPLQSALKTLAAGGDLDADAAEAAVSLVLEGNGGDVPLAAFLTALRVKGETADELAGTVAAVLKHLQAVGLCPAPDGAIDTCGTGGDGANTVNVSTATAIVVAAAGVPVVKHGNRSASGNSGSAEVLGELGVVIDAETEVLNRCLAGAGITFLFAPKFHPGLRHAAAVRKALPFRTLFNLVGPLANPARPTFQLLGVAGAPQADLVAGALGRLGTRRAAVVTGGDGLDEVTLAGPTRVLLVEGGSVRRLDWSPDDFGLGTVDAGTLRVSGPAESASKIKGFLSGGPGPVRATVLANAAAALWVAGRCGGSLAEGVRVAAAAVDDGRAAAVLDRWGALSRGEAR